MANRARNAIQEPLGGSLGKGLQVVTGILGLGALATVTGLFGPIQTFPNETEFARATRDEIKARKPHRCNDRVEDFCRVLFAEDADTLSDLWPSIKHLYACYRSQPGQEPSDPYLMLHPGDGHFVDPRIRAAQQAAAAKKAAPAAGSSQ
uniref:Uncharacterized protein n=1 Tax=Chlamydomonas leiostraca TaxID=1034604 RepID=A0A7S0RGC0_9CHLO|mmetsp:Transcript_22341/g.56856  ORF Transcript_22341/g.56856 Transcript_22341/m.56856 type:complete len:149 (+) Transcript_22341:66-512(+)|eukprot:CAMPEP_0202863066 /NCGR_PEP_ID=MMETSP1391-20130828/3856_1 /ASSEMBLY_ACC=CAM_ASM_000867 /TAXON_ID=1034604 /ORGANISM="Chlamydomonas leiostraca, Strain SAG 11-49" /LENGTH=148 /DNA_ID=CAMNT_0049542663 /DNA_START=66 /DNA_END=512 /DNA_ORIENTATION=-